MANFLTSIFGSRNQRLLRQYSSTVKKINALEEGIKALDDSALSAKTEEFRKRYTDGETLENLLPEVFAVAREAAWRTLHMRPFDVQLIGGMVLHDGNIAEMRTGEGKTLMSTLPAYLNAISTDGVHVVTVNEYLAQRDADWMRPIYEFLGLSVGVSKSGQTQEEKRAAYESVSPTQLTMSLASTTCATISRFQLKTRYSANSISRLWMRSTRFSLMRRVRHSLSRVRPSPAPIFMRRSTS